MKKTKTFVAAFASLMALTLTSCGNKKTSSTPVPPTSTVASSSVKPTAPASTPAPTSAPVSTPSTPASTPSTPASTPVSTPSTPAPSIPVTPTTPAPTTPVVPSTPAPSTPVVPPVVPADPELVLDGEKTITIAAGETVSLPTATATDYDGEDISDSIEIEDGFGEVGTIKDGKFSAKVAGTHIINYYVESAQDPSYYAEENVEIIVTPAHEETMTVAPEEGISALLTYGTYKENFEKGPKAAMGKFTDSNHAAHISGTEEAIAGNSLIIDANRTAGSASNCVFFDGFDTALLKGTPATYTYSFTYKIVEGNGSTFSDFFFSLSWDGSDGLNQTFVRSSSNVGDEVTVSGTFLATNVPDNGGKAYFRFFKLSGSANPAVIAVDNFVFTTKRAVAVTPVVPTSEQLSATDGFTWDFTTNMAAATNGETIIVDDIEDEALKAKLQASEHFSDNALKLINADGHLFSGLTADNLETGKILTLDMDYAAVNDGGFCLIMMGTGGNPTQSAQVTNNSDGTKHVHLETKVQSGWYQLNIYGNSNPSFHIYIGNIKASLAEAAPVPQDQTPNGHEVGYTFSQATRSFGVNTLCKAFDGNEEVTTSDERMGSAPQYLDVETGDKTIEWFQGNGRMETGQTYKLEVDCYVESWAGGRFMFRIDSAFIDIATAQTPGFHHYEVTWTADHQVDYFSFFCADANSTGKIYIGNVTVTLTEIHN